MNQLIQAAQRGDAKEFIHILSHHPNPTDVLNRRDGDGWTVTHHAAKGNSTEIVSLILEKGGDPLSEIPRGRNTPLHLALMSKEENSKAIADILYKKAFELKVVPRTNKEGTHPLHLAAKLGYTALAKSLLKQCPEAKSAANAGGITPLGIALNGGHKKIVNDIIEATEGSPTQFEDFQTTFPSYNVKAQRLLTPPVKIFVVGDNSSGKSTLIKSIQGESFYYRFWGIAYSTTEVPTNKVGLVPSDFLSKNFGRMIFYDLASGANTVHEDLLDSAKDLSHSLFIIVVDNRSEKRVVKQRLEFWLSFILMQCIKFPSQHTMLNHNVQHPQSRPNILIVASFGEVHNKKAFRHAPAVHLNLVVRSISHHNRELCQRLNIVNSIALDCRKVESPPMRILRDELSKICRELRPPAIPLHCRCYILSETLRQLEVDIDSKTDQLPVIKLGNLASLVQKKSSETEPNLYHLLPHDSEKLHQLCLALEEIGRVILIPSSRAIESTWIVYGKAKVANKLDELFVNYVDKQQESTGSIALMSNEALEEYLQPVASNGMDLLTQLLESFKIHDNSVRDLTNLPSEPPYFFFPALLSPSGEADNWDTDYNCFGWSIMPIEHQLSCIFLPRFTKTLLVLLFQHCGDEREFEHRCIWSEGIHFWDKDSADLRQLEVTIIANSKAIIVNIWFHPNIEIPMLQLRNKILSEIRSHKERIQPETAIEESLVLNDGRTVFPVGSQSLPRVQHPITTLRESISKNSLVLSLPPSRTSTHIFGISPVSTSSDSLNSILEDLPFFEPCLHLSKLSLTNQLCLFHPDYANTELTENFLRDFQDCFGHYYRSFAEICNLPAISPTPTSSVHSSQMSIISLNPRQLGFIFSTDSEYAESDIANLSSPDSTCDTFGKLVDCLDSISICKTVEVLTKKAQVSSNPPTSTPTSTLCDFPGDSQQHPATPIPPSNSRLSTASSWTLYPHTTRSPTSSCSGVDLSGIHFIDSLEVITCGQPGGVFHSKFNDVTITIPEGAIPSDVHSVNLEFGVALLGPFDMPSNEMKPVSPFVWICIEAAEFTFSKPISIILPYFISCDTQQDCEALMFMEADYQYIDEEGKFLFRKSNGKSVFRPHRMKGALFTQHPCLLCIINEVANTSISNANYCLMMVMPSRQEARFEVTFCITYLLETCMEIVSRQFSGDGFKIQRKAVKLTPLVPDSDEEAEIRINFQSALGEGWVAANMSGHWEIPASAIAFWNRDIDKLLDRYKMYPPRFVIDVNGTSATKASCLTVEFTGLRKKVQFQMTLSYTFGSNPGYAGITVHSLDRHVLALNQYLNIGLIRMSLRSRGALTEDEMEQLLDLSIRGLERATIIETLMKYIKSKGDEGMINFMSALEETQDGTGHATILQILNDDDDLYEAEESRVPAQIMTPVPQNFPSIYFTEAEKSAQVPFLCYHLVECDYHGKEYTVEDHDITIRIPKEAIPKGKKTHIEIAVTMYGPFKFIGNVQPISPILWLCLEENSVLSKPLQVVLPHFLIGLDDDEEKAQYHQVTFAKADHGKYTIQDDQMTYHFQPCESHDSEPYFASSGSKSYGVLLTKHCCFYCLQANKAHNLATDAGYCLARIESFVTQKRSEIYLSAVYFLPTCLKALEEQFPREEGYQITNYSKFIFRKGDSESEPCINITPLERDHDPLKGSQLVIALEPVAAKIKEVDINFWTQNFTEMQLRHERKMYPPRVKMTVDMKNPDATVKLLLRINGTENQELLDAELNFPLTIGSSSMTGSSRSSGSYMEPHSHKITSEKPTLKNVVKDILPLATDWKIIGALLGIEHNVLKMIKANEASVRDCLEEMISEWLKRVDPPPTWAALADAVETLDEVKAREIRAKRVDV